MHRCPVRRLRMETMDVLGPFMTDHQWISVSDSPQHSTWMSLQVVPVTPYYTPERLGASRFQ